MLQYRSTLQPYILVTVGVVVFLRGLLVLQPYNTNLPIQGKKLPGAMAKHALQYRKFLWDMRGGGQKICNNFLPA